MCEETRKDHLFANLNSFLSYTNLEFSIFLLSKNTVILFCFTSCEIELDRIKSHIQEPLAHQSLEIIRAKSFQWILLRVYL